MPVAARRLWPGVVNPVGRRLQSKPPITVVGVVDDTRASGIDNEVRPYVYVPFWVFTPDSFALAIRADGNLSALASAAKAEVWRVDKTQPITHVEPMTAVVADSIGSRWFDFVLMAIFGGMTNLYGPVIGAAAFAYLEDILTTKFPNYYMLIFGLTMVIVITFLPDGLIGLVRRLWKGGAVKKNAIT